ncbi:hypothetical protein IM753_11625 [Moraxella sp. K127]|uniref:hypothetical protein n=1 Tax=Moraxella TaxID=475 RepID=UPI001882ACEB|nr:hypothetical protein [Moraxella sp. K127]MBE9591603.1 hypothetical protein [Moraxella sp. K127]
MKRLDEINPFQKIIDEFYQVFNYPAPTEHLNVCSCGGCIDDEIELQMRTLPLHELTKEHFYQYNTSAKDEVENPNELKYFLPRMVELFVQGKELHHSTELYFQRVGNCSKESFTPKEWVLWDKFANLYLDNLLKQYPYECFDFLSDNIFAILLMFNLTHIDIEPFLMRWRNADTSQAIAHYIHASWMDYWFDDDGFGEDVGFFGYSDDFIPLLEHWLNHPEHKSYFAQQILLMDKNVLDEIEYFADFYPDYIEKLLKKMS